MTSEKTENSIIPLLRTQLSTVDQNSWQQLLETLAKTPSEERELAFSYSEQHVHTWPEECCPALLRVSVEELQATIEKLKHDDKAEREPSIWWLGEELERFFGMSGKYLPVIELWGLLDEQIEKALFGILTIPSRRVGWGGGAHGELDDLKPYIIQWMGIKKMADEIDTIVSYALYDDAEYTGERAIEALACIGTDEAYEAIAKVLFEGDVIPPGVIYTAVEALQERGTERDIELLIEAYSQRHIITQEAVYDALKSIGTPRTLAAIEEE